MGRNLPRKALSNLSIKWLNDGKMWEVCGPAQKSSKIRIETTALWEIPYIDITLRRAFVFLSINA